MSLPIGRNARFNALAFVILAGVVSATVAGRAYQKADEARSHGVVTPDDLKWAPFIPGSQMAVVAGDPTQSGPFVFRLKSAAGTKIPPHWHPANENVTLLQGTFAVGMGDTFDETNLTRMHPGDFVRVPANAHHFAMAVTDTIVQVHGMGPFVVNFVNPADDPRLKH